MSSEKYKKLFGSDSYVTFQRLQLLQGHLFACIWMSSSNLHPCECAMIWQPVEGDVGSCEIVRRHFPEAWAAAVVKTDRVTDRENTPLSRFLVIMKHSDSPETRQRKTMGSQRGIKEDLINTNPSLSGTLPQWNPNTNTQAKDSSWGNCCYEIRNNAYEVKKGSFSTKK